MEKKLNTSPWLAGIPDKSVIQIFSVHNNWDLVQILTKFRDMGHPGQVVTIICYRDKDPEFESPTLQLLFSIKTCKQILPKESEKNC